MYIPGLLPLLNLYSNLNLTGALPPPSSSRSTPACIHTLPTPPPSAFPLQHQHSYQRRHHARQAPASSWSAVGCATDGPSRALTATSTVTSMNSVEMCEAFCSAAGYPVAGVEFGDECYCGTSYSNGLGGVAPNSDCNVACAGNSAETCGGSYRLNVYSLVAAPTPTPTSSANNIVAYAVSSASWSNLGCATDVPSRALTALMTSTNSNSVEFCENYCFAAGYMYAGVEYGSQCFCGNTLANGGGQAAPSGDCNSVCPGNSAEMCGGGYRMNLYSQIGASASPTPTGWSAVGCATDGPSRALTALMTQTNANTIEFCENYCGAAGYTYAGVEYGSQCFCGNSLANGLGQAASSGDCNSACAGNSAETCGGSYRLNLFSRIGGTTAAPTSTRATTTTTTTAASTTSWANLGCATDTGTRALTGPNQQLNSVTVESCKSYCGGQGYVYAGVEDGNQCFCGNALSNGAGQAAPSTDCNMACAGNSAETCGGSYRLNLYSLIGGTTATPTTTPTTTTSTTTTAATTTGNWANLGCATDTSARALTGPNQQLNSVTVESCESFCGGQGYIYAGVEDGNQCFCGNALSNGAGQAAPSTDCNMACAGNSAETCGGGYRLNLYSRIGATATATATTTSWAVLGCATDTAQRALTGPMQQTNTVTIESCESYCGGAGYVYAGVENGNQCFCGNTLSNGAGQTAPSTDCNTPCSGNSAETCGGGYRLNLFSLVGASPTAGGAVGSGGTPTTTMTSAATSTMAVAPAGSQLVVAHFMVGNTYPYQQSDWANDIALASANGIDGFALNYGSDSWQPARLSDAYAAALGYPNFRLFLSADMSSVPGAGTGDATNLANQVNQFTNHPNQLKYNGGVLLSTFSGETSQFGYGSIEAGWSAVISQINTTVTFIPSWFVDPSTFGNYPVLQGAFNWNGGWPMSNTDITFASDQQWLSGLNGKLYIAPVTPNFFTHYSPQTYNKNFIYRNDDNLYANRWEMLIANRAQIALAEIITWNDYGESHYIGPIEGAQPNSQAWVNGYPHTAWLDLTAYYAPAFKTGVYPAITKDKIYIYARPHPKNAQACCDSVAQPTGYQNTDDNFYALVLATASGSLILGTPPTPSSSTPSSSNAGPQTMSVTAGVNKFSLALVPSNGMRATLMRGTTQVLDLWPQNYTFNPSPQTYNFNAFVSMAST